MRYTEEQKEAIRKYYPDGNDEKLLKYFPSGLRKERLIDLAHDLGVKRKKRYNFKDLTGQQFGRLTALSIDHKGHEVFWKCVCTCGKERVVASSSLVHGQVKSCGCTNYADDLTGQRFGRLVAVERILNYKGTTYTRYRCICDCGKEVVVYMGFLKNGTTTSCGCYQKEQASKTSRSQLIASGCTDYGINLNGIRRAVEGKKRSDNTSGVTGVIWHPDKQKYVASIKLRKKTYYLGAFKDFDEAVKVRKKAEKKVFGEYLEEISREWDPVDDAELTDEERKFRQSVREVLALLDGKEEWSENALKCK
jgi:hypothetical protein